KIGRSASRRQHQSRRDQALVISNPTHQRINCRPRESGDPYPRGRWSWVPAFAGPTMDNINVRSLPAEWRRMIDSTPLIFPQLGPVYQALFPWAEALLRAVVGLALVPHGLRNTFGMFPSTGVQSHNLTELAKQLDRDGYRPGKFWAPAISLTQLVAGPMLALGLFTR